MEHLSAGTEHKMTCIFTLGVLRGWNNFGNGCLLFGQGICSFWLFAMLATLTMVVPVHLNVSVNYRCGTRSTCASFMSFHTKKSTGSINNHETIAGPMAQPCGSPWHLSAELQSLSLLIFLLIIIYFDSFHSSFAFDSSFVSVMIDVDKFFYHKSSTSEPRLSVVILRTQEVMKIVCFSLQVEHFLNGVDCFQLSWRNSSFLGNELRPSHVCIKSKKLEKVKCYSFIGSGASLILKGE